MYYVGIIIFSALMVGIFFLTSAVGAFIDFPSIIVVLGLSTTLLIASGLLNDFFKGFKMMGEKVNTFSLIEVKRMLTAIKLMTKLLFVSGIIGTISGFVGMLSNYTSNDMLPKSIAMVCLTTVYALICILIILPIEAKAKAIIASLE